MKTKFLLIVAGLLLVLFSYSSAQVPQLINYQGKLTKASGAPLDTTISIVFTIYNAEVGGIALWADTQSTVVVEKGIFNVLLGSVNPIPDSVFDGSIRYLGVKVGGDPEITPRKPMVSVPYAYRAATGAGDNDWTINGDTIYHLNGNVGIGTASPVQKLHVYSSGTNTGILVDGGSSGRARLGLLPGGVDAGELGYKNYLEIGTIADASLILSPKVHITTDGNVGIGTTAPNEQLEITGNLRLPVSTASAGMIKSGADRFIHNFGTNNFFAGVNAGNFSLSGSNNTGVGWNALLSLTTGFSNTAVGRSALLWNATGSQNTAVGLTALVVNSTGGSNTAVGQSALSGNTTGGGNTAVGLLALISNSTGMYNTAIGYQANVSAGGLTNATAIGYNAVVDASNKVRIGNTFVTSIGGQVGWSVFSDGRLKTNVKKSPLGLDFILKLNPITYNSLSPGQEGITYTGLIAQQVEKVLQELGADFSGLDKPKNKDGFYQLRYAEFVMPLIKAIQELNARNEKLEARLAELEALVKSLAANPSTPNQSNSYEAGAQVTK